MKFTPIIKPRTVGERIKQERERLGMTIQDLGDNVLLSDGYIEDMESGRNCQSGFTMQESIEYITKIAAALRVNLLWLATGEGKRAKTQAKKGSQ